MKTIFLCVFFCVLSGFSVHAQQFFLNTSKGFVEVGDGTTFKKARVGDLMKLGQTIRTAADSTAIVVYPDKSILKLNPNTTITLATETQAELKSGAVFAKVPKLDHPHFTIKTPTAVAGVRGTQFFTTYGDNNDGWLCVKEGAVEVTPIGNLKPVVVKEGLGIVFKPGKEIAAPEKYKWTEGLNWNMDEKSGDIMDKTSPKSVYKSFLKYNYD